MGKTYRLYEGSELDECLQLEERHVVDGDCFVIVWILSDLRHLNRAGTRKNDIS